MIKKAAFALATAGAVIAAAPASAAVVFTTTWEGVPGGPTSGTFVIFNNPPTTVVDGWTPDTQIELQNNVAGAPAPDGGDVFAELDADFNSSMHRTIGAGTYELSFLYSPRPANPFSSNGIVVTLDGAEIAQLSATGITGGQTAWSQIVTQQFTVAGPGVLRFAANGTSDSRGGYLDNITLTAVPEPSTWALFILGFGGLGYAMRRRNAQVKVAKASLRFA